MQISTQRGNGLVSIANGTNRVVATSLLADWSQAVAGSSWFTLIGDTAMVRTIQALYPPATPTASGFWEADLDEIFTLPSVVGVSYAIHKDFTERWHLPTFEPGDVQRSQLWNRAMWIIDGALGSAGGVGGNLTGFDVTTLDKPKPSLWWKMGVQDGFVVLEWWLLQAGAPTANDTATSDDAGSRWRKVG